MPEFKYVVVEFIDEHTLSVIPSTWLDGTSCALWPPYDNTTRCCSAAKRRDVPGDDWQSFPIKEWYGTNEWDEANRKLRRLEENSSVDSTDVENLGRSKRRKRQRRYSDSDSEASASSQTKLGPSKPRKQASPSAPSAPPVPPTPPDLQVMQPRLLSSSQRGSPSTSTPRQSHEMIRVSAIEPILHRIFKSLEEIKADQKKIRQKIERMREEKAADPASANLGNTFPLKTQEDLVNLERKLQDESFRGKVVWYLGAFNARSVNAGVKRMLEETMENILAMKYNLSGKGKSGKKSFQQLHLYKTIFDAIRKHHSDATDKEFRVGIINWFDGAKDRQGGRKKRAEEAKLQNHEDHEARDHPENLDLDESNHEELSDDAN